MIQTFIAFFVIMACGVLWRALPSVPSSAEVRKVLTSVVLYFFLPALAFKAIVQAPLEQEIAIIPLAAAISCSGAIILGFLLYRLLHRLGLPLSMPRQGALLLAAGWSNATYLGIPALSAILGNGSERYAIFFDILALTPLLLTVGASIASTHQEKKSDLAFSEIIRAGVLAALRLPPLWAAGLAIAWNISGISIPAFLLQTVSVMSTPVAPLMIFSVGLALRPISFATIPILLPAVFLKLIVVPFIAWSITLLFTIDPELRSAITLEAAMPTMVLTITIADRFGLDTEILAQAIAISTVLSFVTLPMLATLLGVY